MHHQNILGVRWHEYIEKEKCLNDKKHPHQNPLGVRWHNRMRRTLNMARTARIRSRIIECLTEYGTANSQEVYAYVKEKMRHGATMNQIGNLLSKDKRIVKTGMTRVANEHSSYQVATWKLKETNHN